MQTSPLVSPFSTLRPVITPLCHFPCLQTLKSQQSHSNGFFLNNCFCSTQKCPHAVKFSIYAEATPCHISNHQICHRFHGDAGLRKCTDVSTLGNLCVDIVLNVPSLPPASVEEKREYMGRLSASKPDMKYWEAGGNCNLAIAAARLGLCCVTLGHVGHEIYGRFLLDVLGDEGITMVGMDGDTELGAENSSFYETLICWVLVDPLQRHGFCSRSDFSKDPAFNWMIKLSRNVELAIRQSKILFCNGYIFDELSPDLIVSAINFASDVGTSIFFDPGPRAKSLSKGLPIEQRALNKFLGMSDVLLLTADEAESLTGVANPVMAGQELIRRGLHTKWVIIKLGSMGSILITKSHIFCAPAFKVDVVDTVGCGDSFSAAIIYGFLNNIPEIHTLLLANAVGGATATGCGAGRHVATLDKVLELLRASNLYEEERLWSELNDGDVDGMEVTVLQKTAINGSRDHLNRISVKKVVADLLPRLENMKERTIAPLS
ncbi:fructokinase-1 isoform X1 [Amborella trichopoda]|uniref:Carbohydrate kinase PfkB domain-containing protein n=1 Tax=Amborella trichopoda TaxID=13333 RepID=W1NUS9_AMBTC|nr:fructokinase-1 isoform X1 [Amborella trichopoda]ERN01387.1 hypothetical protein AMTR_s00002p00262620 [Amborella trichopoda]|eukprot:XP_006838818.1 fructokinase-1 isoform X1 [Amborella trichopoda]